HLDLPYYSSYSFKNIEFRILWTRYFRSLKTSLQKLFSQKNNDSSMTNNESIFFRLNHAIKKLVQPFHNTSPRLWL
ncbi:hypothetical protein AOA60_26385, partial [Pseudomonas sp. 2822-17]